MERLARAHESSDLSESTSGPGDVDWLRASGMVAQHHSLALSIWRLIEHRDKRALARVFQGMVELVPIGATAPAMRVSHVLTWMLDPLCPECGGRGYAQIPGTPALSALACKACDGTGRSTPAWTEGERDLHTRVQTMMTAAEAAIARKLRGG